jgi:hypothetical protein
MQGEIIMQRTVNEWRLLMQFPSHARYSDGIVERYLDNTMPARPLLQSMTGNGAVLTAESAGAEGDDTRELKAGARHSGPSDVLKAAWVKRLARQRTTKESGV